MKSIIKNSFWQLAFIYAVLILLISLSLFWKYSLYFQVFALIISIFGISLFVKESNKQIKISKILHIGLFVLAILLIFLFRTIPYMGNSVPIGYDSGIYKYGIENGLQNLDKWVVQGGMEPGFLYLMEPFKLLFSTQFILTWLLIGFCVLLGIAIYFVAKEYFGKTEALIALLLYAVSIVQFKTFALMYYKNIVALSFMLFSLYFLKKSETNKHFRWAFILLAGLIGAIHRPTFYIFGLAYLLYTLVSPYKGKNYNINLLLKNIVNGLIILAIFSVFYFGTFSPAVLSMFEPVANAFFNSGESPGTFINFFNYQFAILAYLPFALLGAFYLVKKKQLNIILLWTIINASIVYFQFFFFNRFIIHLDVALILLASFGFGIVIKANKKLGSILLVILFLSAFFVTLNEARQTLPLIDQDELQIIEKLKTTPENSLVMATSSYYSPWLQGYSGRRVIAPGLFDYNKWNKEEWMRFWNAEESEMKTMLSTYEKPLYIFIGKHQPMNQENFNNECFSLFEEKNQAKIYEYVC